MDVAVLPVNMAAKLRSAGVPIVLAAIVGDGMVLSFLTSDPAVRSLADLRGKETPCRGDRVQRPDYLIQKLLSRAGARTLQRTCALSYSLPYPEMGPPALAGGKIQYAILPEPFATPRPGGQSLTQVADRPRQPLEDCDRPGQLSHGLPL